MHYSSTYDRYMPPHYSAAAAKLHQLQNQNHRAGLGPSTFGLYGSSLVSSTGETLPSTIRQYSALSRKYGADNCGGDELAACLPPDLRHLLSATNTNAPQSHHRQTTTQRLQQHGLLRSNAATSAANALGVSAALSQYGGNRKPWSSSSSWSYHDDSGIGHSSVLDRRIVGTNRHAFFGVGGLDPHNYRAGGRAMTMTRSLGGAYDGNSLLYRCSTSNVPDNLERRWYQNQQPRQVGSGARLIRGFSGTKHLSDMYDDDDLLRMHRNDNSVAALLLDDGVLGGGYNSRNSDFLPSRPRSRSYGGGEDPSSSTSWRHWPDSGDGSGYLGGALRETAIGSSAAIFDHNGHRRGIAAAMNSTMADHKRWDVRRQNRRQRRYSDGSGESDPRRSYDYQNHLQMTTPVSMMKYGVGGGRRSRSWDPSPMSTPTMYLSGGGGDDGYGGGYGDYVDDYGDYDSLAADEDHDEELQREEKKARIKAEIARRRRQIEDNVRLHEELLRLARIRENAEHEYSSSILPSLSTAGRRPMTEDECQVFTRAAEKIAEERSMERIASTFTKEYIRRGGVMVSGYYDDFCPAIASNAAVCDYTPPHAMPLLPDLPTRSRRLLENLGSSPITGSMLLDNERKSIQKKVNFLNVS